jgi:meiotic recombination protein SPO11
MARNIYYQNPGLFKSQSVVDDMVDSLALSLGVGRDDLNIASPLHPPTIADSASPTNSAQVAAAKGLISGPIDLMLRDGSSHSCDVPGDTVRHPSRLGMTTPDGSQ